MTEAISEKLKEFLYTLGFTKKTSVEIKYDRSKNPTIPWVEIIIRGPKRD